MKNSEYQQSIQEKEKETSVNSLIETICEQFHAQISSLEGEVSYLREESNKKSKQIDSLIAIIGRNSNSLDSNTVVESKVNDMPLSNDKDVLPIIDIDKELCEVKNAELIREKIENQLMLVRKQSHTKFLDLKMKNDIPSEDTSISQNPPNSHKNSQLS